VHDPDLGVAVEGAWATDAEHLLPAAGGSRKPKGGLRVDLGAEHRLARQGGSAGFYGRAEGFGVGIFDLALGVSAPELAGDLVQGGWRAA
jgi:hypothetical protein